MPKEYFKLENTASLESLKSGSKIHVIGICGVAMAQLSVLLAKKGFSITGSDKEFYEPMGSLLKNSKISTFTGYKKENIPDGVNLVVIGNAISYGNPEVLAVEEKSLPYTCFPKILAESVIAEKHSIVASGTHGKSTTSAMIAYMLISLGLDPSYFVGGITEDLELSLHAGKGKHSIVEGDEYDSAFFAKVPKFSFYKPKTCIINAIEFDHADIYPNLEAINKEFTEMVNSIPAEGQAVCCLDYENIRNLIPLWKKSAKCKFITFGENKNSDLCITSATQAGLAQIIKVQSKEFGDFTFELSVPGMFNAKNALAALITAKLISADFEKAKTALKNFKGVKRRQQVRFNNGKIILIEDFAHHPTAVKETINALKAAFPDKRLIAVFEPRSNTSRRKVFQKDYVDAFANSAEVILCNVETREIDAGQELLDVKTLSGKITESGVPAVCLENAKDIEEYVISGLIENSLIVVMSNGSFGGLPQNLENRLRRL
jgi:UDP-N-acetylmuramate: L-alanyl-gamma-D-glutamyl-meso-diaminopimelate ligase